MKVWLKQHFIPHEGNAHQPRLLERRNVTHLAGALLAIELVFFLGPTLAFPQFISTLNLSAVLPGALSALTNAERAGNNVPVLAENPLLTRAATLKAEDMASKSYFAHTSPEGKTPWYWFNLVGYQYAYAGENLAVNFSDSADVTRAWMNSPTHRANIIAKNYSEIGTGMATGTYKGNESIFVAQLFGAPRSTMQVSGASSVSAWTMLLLSPHGSVNIVLLALLILTLGTLALYLSMRPERRRRELVGNGLFLAVLIVGLYFGNAYLSGRNFETTFIAFDDQNIIAE